MAKASHSLVRRNLPTGTATFSCTSAATSSGTKKIRRIVSESVETHTEKGEVECGKTAASGRSLAGAAFFTCAGGLRARDCRRAAAAYTCISAMLVSRRHFFFGSLALPAFAAKKPAPERPN